MTESKSEMPRPMLTARQVAEWLAVDLATLELWRRQGKGPKCSKLNDGPTSPIRYRAGDVEQFIREREVQRDRPAAPTTGKPAHRPRRTAACRLTKKMPKGAMPF